MYANAPEITFAKSHGRQFSPIYFSFVFYFGKYHFFYSI